MKTLYIISRGMGKKSEEEMLRLEQANEIPRASLLEKKISAELLDERYLSDITPAWRRFFYRFIPVYLAQVLEALFIMHRYDAILSHSEKAGLPLALIMKILRIRKAHILILSRITSVDEDRSRQKIWFLKKTRDKIDRILIWSSVQRTFAIEKLGISPDKIILLKRGTDQKFWKPVSDISDKNMIGAAGMEARDYPTLIEAMRGVDIPCHIAVDSTRGEIFDTVKALFDIEEIPESVSIGPKTPVELRDMYSSCRFVVIPLMESDSDNGLTTLLESMSMGLPVICSQTEGQVDVIQEGVTGIFVPQGDPVAMRNAIKSLWNDPEKCRIMGQNAQEYLDRIHNVEQFVDSIHREICNAISSYSVESATAPLSQADA